jgi:hypothetical protein
LDPDIWAGSRVPLVLDAATLTYLGAIPVYSEMLSVRGLDIGPFGHYLDTLSREGTIVTTVRLSDWRVVAHRVIGTSDGGVNTGRDGIVALGATVYATVGSQTDVRALSAISLQPLGRRVPCGIGLRLGEGAIASAHRHTDPLGPGPTCRVADGHRHPVGLAQGQPADRAAS